MKNLVAFWAHKEESIESSDSDVDDGEYHVLLNKYLNLKNENLRLQYGLVQSHEQDEKQSELVEELVGLKEKNESFKHEDSKLRKIATGEQARAKMLECDLADNFKQIKMLSGSKDLDKILSMGQPAKVNWGLGYRGAESTKKVEQKRLSYFVQRSTSKGGSKEVRREVRRDVRQGVRQEVL